MQENMMPTVYDSDEMESHSEEETRDSEDDVVESDGDEETKDSESDALELNGEEEPHDDKSSDDDDSNEENLGENSASNDEEDDKSSGDDALNEEIDAVEQGLGANAGWANSISKILNTNKAKGKASLVLSKARKLTDLKVKVKREKEAGFEVESKDGKIKREMIEESDSDESEEPLRKKRRDLPCARMKPNILEKDRERLLLKIATKGVVQLFNAVKQQQKDIDTKLSEVGPVDAKREKVLKNLDKNEFLNVLMGDQRLNTTNVETKEEKLLKDEKKSAKVTWNVLRDDFMMDANMKDWDKSLEEEDEIQESDTEVV